MAHKYKRFADEHNRMEDGFVPFSSYICDRRMDLDLGQEAISHYITNIVYSGYFILFRNPIPCNLVEINSPLSSLDEQQKVGAAAPEKCSR